MRTYKNVHYPHASKALATFYKRLARMHDVEVQRCRAFAAKLGEQPAEALAWGLDAIEAAAYEEVSGIVLAMLTDPQYMVSATELSRFASNEIQRRAISPARSTSPISDLIQQQRLVAWAQIADELHNALADADNEDL